MALCPPTPSLSPCAELGPGCTLHSSTARPSRARGLWNSRLHCRPLRRGPRCPFTLAWSFPLGVTPGEGQGQVPLQLGVMPSLPRAGSRLSFLLLQGPKCGSEALWSTFQNQMRKPHPSPAHRKPGGHLDDSLCLKICSLSRDVVPSPTQVLLFPPSF